MTPPSDGLFLATSVHTVYDTKMGIFTGSCGTLTEIAYNDNDGLLMTSILEIPVSEGVDYYILVAGYGPADGGALTFGTAFSL